MLKNYFHIALRNLLRQKFYAFINILSLAIGISICLLIFMYAFEELHYDHHHPKANRIYRVPTSIKSSQGQVDNFALGNLMLPIEIMSRYTEVENYCRFLKLPRQTVYHNNQTLYESQVAFCDGSVFTMFDFKLLLGNPENALSQPNKIVISYEKARQYFGSPGRALNKPLKFSKNTYQVSGVLEKSTESTQFQYDMLLSLATLPDSLLETYTSDPMRLSSYNYLLLREGSTQESLVQKLDEYAKGRVQTIIDSFESDNSITYYLQPLTKVHLSQTYEFDYSHNNNPIYIYTFLSVGLFVLVIACINYMNLATAKSVRRAKEVGIRKAIGAQRRQLFLQFMIESFLSTVLALFLALALIEVFLPTFNRLSEKSLGLSDLLHIDLLLSVLVLLLFSAVLAGSYPALYLSAFRPTSVLKAHAISEKMPTKKWLNPTSLRRTLVVFQFILSIVLIIGTMVVYSQIEYMKNKDLGFRKKAVCVIDIPFVDSTMAHKLEGFRQEVAKLPEIILASRSTSNMHEGIGRISNEIIQDGKKISKTMNTIFIDDNFIKTLDITLKKGRSFDKSKDQHLGESIIINEAAAKALGWKAPLGKEILNHYTFMANQKDSISDQAGAKVIGVVKDFNYSSLQNPIEPLIMMYNDNLMQVLLVSIKPGEIFAAMTKIKSLWRKFSPKHPLNYSFLDQSLAQIYEKEEKLLTLFGYFSILAILISCLGVFGLASYTTEQRTREIGIRKVLGASTNDITRLITQDFLRLVLLASLLAFPVAYLLMDYWLQDFAYRIALSWFPFVFAGLLAFCIVLVTVSLLAFRAAKANPMKSLRYE